MFDKKENAGMSSKKMFGLVGILMLALSAAVYGQTATPTPTDAAKPAAQQMSEQKKVLQPAMTEYRGIKIDMTADEVREKIDKKPQVADKDGFYYVFSDDESAQITLDKSKKVRVISVMYSAKDAAAPKYEDVFGADVPVAKKPSGRIYNLVRYPEAGYWVAYNRSAGDNAATTVTMQRMRQAK